MLRKNNTRLSTQDKESLYMNYFETVYQTALFLIRDRWAGEDITYDTFNIVFEKYYQLKDHGKIVPWIRTITLNVARSYLKRNNKVTLIDITKNSSTLGQTLFSTVEDIIQERETSQLLREAILSLPIEFQEVALLKYYDGLEVAEIANLLKIPEGTVKSRLCRAKEKIRKHIQKLENVTIKVGL